MNQLTFERSDLTPHPKAMDPVFKKDDVVLSYRNFYLRGKSKFATWNKGREAPPWYLNDLYISKTQLPKEI